MATKTTQMQMVSIKHWVAAFACWAVACAGTSDERETTGKDDDDDAQEAHDREACLDAADEFRERGCPVGLLPRVQLGGDPVVATRIDEVGMPICDDLGRLIDSGVVEDPEWLGTDLFQNPHCTIGCFVPECGRPSDLCLAGFASGGLCAAYCSNGIDAQGCRSLVLDCNGVEPEDVDPDDEACGLAKGEGEDQGG